MLQEYMSGWYFKGLDLVPDHVKWRLARTPLVHVYRGFSGLIGRGHGEGYYTVESGPLQGVAFYTGSAADRGYATIRLYQAGTYEPDVAAAIVELCQPGATVCDIGAHFGYFSLLMARCVGKAGLCVAFEPLEANYHKILNTATANHQENLRVENLAISERDEQVEFSVHANTLMGRLADGVNGHSTTAMAAHEIVQTRSLDSYLEETGLPPVSFLKIDVEGAEYRVLQGARQTLEQSRPALLIEVHHFGDAETQARSLAAMLRELHYDIYDLHARRPLDAAHIASGHLIALPGSP